MHAPRARDARATSSDQVGGDLPAFVPLIGVQEILRRLVADELSAGRLTPARRRQIEHYAVEMGLSVHQARRLLESCRDHALIHGNATARCHALRLLNPSSRKTVLALRIAIFLTAVILFDLLLICWP
ncbi:MAG: hypothetical protein IID38_00335 [Planctomycetes bacterium]|nr:hypothetical protein [Planctomycetota bacterium]